VNFHYDVPDDNLWSEANSLDLVPAGQWLLGVLVPELEDKGVRFSYVDHSGWTGYWVVKCTVKERVFLLYAYCVKGSGNLHPSPCRSFGEWLGRRNLSTDAEEFANLLAEVMRRDQRVRDVRIGDRHV